MTLLEKFSNVGQAKQWSDNIPTSYLYSYGLAGERFFHEIKENGRLMAARCSICRITYLPPRLYCEECFEKLGSWREIQPAGEIFAFTIAHISMEGNQLSRPETLAFIQFNGIKGGLIHRIGNLGHKRASIGLKVKPRFKPKTKRIGSINDIEFFEPF